MVKMDISYTLVLSTEELRLVVSALGNRLPDSNLAAATTLQAKIIKEKVDLLSGMLAGANKALDNIRQSQSVKPDEQRRGYEQGR